MYLNSSVGFGQLSITCSTRPSRRGVATYSATCTLQDEFNILIEERARLTETLRAAKALSGETQGFSDEAKIQAERLESIGLFE
jgi:hypothetical protein